MIKGSVLSNFDRKAANELLESKVKQYAEKLSESFQLSFSSSSLPKLPSLSVPSSVRLKQQYSLLLFQNHQREQHLAELQSVYLSMLTINEQAANDYEMTLSARSADVGEGHFEKIDRIKAETADIEGKTMQEAIAADQLAFVVKKTKEKIVIVTQTHLRQRLQQITHFSTRLLKDAPRIQTMQAESLNDLTHSVYTLQKCREENKKQREKRVTLLQVQKDASKRVKDENEGLTEEVARKAVVKQELSTRTRLVIQDMENTFRQKRERQSSLAQYAESAARYQEAMSRLEA